ncbi:hypothetical protein KIH39_01595 [Telmatocola sphagniphila]|uniref:Lipoprotein n=1 Tax=Telmatocola sphagniphila TaxID=1123043 RepID=A0A8E6B672_9BACT|nr:hypothetical protein [Telmatocola sphagniphila]QVL32637.1 hypothetical protein KIH39_01595 [Telmatocola sphagniphila]
MKTIRSCTFLHILFGFLVLNCVGCDNSSHIPNPEFTPPKLDAGGRTGPTDMKKTSGAPKK